MASEAEVESNVHEMFEFPTVSNAVVGQNPAPSQSGKFRKNRAGPDPCCYAIAMPDVLAEFDASIEFAFISIASFEIAAHIMTAAND